ncbi:LysM peptidoglycan-binding domain-containing protein [Solibacillus sp. CAU 1738]|uniref:LysM peptidoglycan-binding and 3D domain-containing protein n=1 Tax=Solibacillus sp. CAU 1738 TaxID=3140363 RepID=UPI00325FE58D
MNKKFLAFATIFTLTVGSYSSIATAETHTVQEGDSLWEISQQYSISVENLKELNNLDSSLIFPNQQLKVAEKGTVYTIQPNDTLSDIAAEFNVTIDELMAWNDLTSDMIYSGDTLVVSGSGDKAKQERIKSQKETNKQTQSKQTQSKQTQSKQPPKAVEKTLTMEATAYTANCNGCSGITANGTDLRSNPNLKVIAVDPNVIPLGTKVWVEGYGEAIAADTGGAIKGNKIDVFIPSKDDANSWGIKTVTVKILE